MVRQLKYHEQKLLRKVDFFTWKKEDNDRQTQVMRRYHIQKREDYLQYNRIVGQITKITNKLSLLPPDDPYRKKTADQLLHRLFTMGVLPSDATLSQCSELAVSAFCRRRLSTIMVTSKMAETMKEAVTFIEQGQVRVGPDVIADPAFLVTRPMEDFVTWVDSSKIRRKIHEYNDTVDDYDLSVC